MDIKKILLSLGFKPKNNTVDVYAKAYPQHSGYAIEVDFSKKSINYGKIAADCKTTQNFSQDENWVVLECVNRLLEKGYSPKNIILEKTWPSGHGTSGRLDICVNKDDGSEFLLIECKTWGKKFDKELNNMQKNGGQLFTYFKFSNKADVLMLYTSKLDKNNFEYKNAIIKIEDDYRIGDIKDFYDKWNKLTKDNGVFETWVAPYSFESKALIKSQLKPITQDDSSFIFNQFLEILRHNVVSDKGNAFNKIFTLFLCKVYDETSKQDEDELDFQWKEGRDDNVSFQLRLTDLYKNGMKVFLSRVVSDFDEKEFENKYQHLSSQVKEQLLQEINILRLEKNNEFAIKEVYDHDSFIENAKIVKEVVELLQSYRIRYNKRQQYLSDFFELLLTTGLKQEAGQFFTPVPIAQFIIKSLPLDEIVSNKLNSKDGNILPYMIDYAAGSGHFITEYMHEVQDIINKKEPSKYIQGTKNSLLFWQNANYEWATDYVYGIEKDYRLVKVGKVGCYLHGDGLANVILSDGLGNFVNTKDYKGKLHKDDDDGSKDNQQFDIILSNPPYSVSSFKQTTRDYYTEKDFELYNSLTDNSSEIECLFVERTKQLLKDRGVAGIILPSSILTNSGIYTKTRELLLKYFEIVGITELGSNTFMATGTNTVVLFLRRRNNYECINLQKSVDKFFADFIDVTINEIETPISKYVSYVWEGLTFEDYITLLEKNPNDKVKSHDLYKEYSQKIKQDKEFWNKVIAAEKEKLYYFILAYPQKVVIIKTGEKDAEKRFLGYEFSNRRGAEGIHATQRGKSIDDCTRLFDINSFDNPQKASTYIYKAFKNEKIEIDETLKDNISIINLLDMMTFDRVDFEKTINVKAKKKIKIESKYNIIKIKEICEIGRGRVISKKEISENRGTYPVYSSKSLDEGILGTINSYDFNGEYVTWTTDGIYAGSVFYRNGKFNCTNVCGTLKAKSNNINMKYLSVVLPQYTTDYVVRVANPKLMNNVMAEIKLPLPPLDIQQKIVDEIDEIDKTIALSEERINSNKNEINRLLEGLYESTTQKIRLSDSTLFYLSIGRRVLNSDLMVNGKIPVYSANVFQPFGYIDKMLISDFTKSSVLWGIDGDWMTNVIAENIPFYPTDHCGFIRILKENIITEKYLAFALNEEGKILGFSRSKRASIDRVEGIAIPLPKFKDQQKAISQIVKLEKQIDEAQKAIDASAELKNAVLKKYL